MLPSESEYFCAQEALLDFGRHPDDSAVLHGGIEVGAPDVFVGRAANEALDLLGYLLPDLTAVRSVDLVAVVLLGIVAGRHHDAALTPERAHGVTDHGRGLEAVEQIDLDAVGRIDLGRAPCERLGHVPAVKPDRQRRMLEVCVQILRHAAGGTPHRQKVHAVGSRPQDAAQAGGAKLQLAVEAFLDLLLVARNTGQLRMERLVTFGQLQPLLICLIHQINLLLFPFYKYC